ncbi:hypothetical protein HFP15_30565 [Amycolatopsis sp. K13G38]|uniref:ChsH2 C-terminal OB-fold domain-containing protein n=1 Tax=Amycolatopsis acididurans TaxID=2724524 RepID=A0ABX1JBQ5_9PSEU|nr:OB-fold domain-containing protein [Amycolatopsis acididurans]NKQ57223.1 hypothetical protein [Amycolatopsis acididurans]
MVNVETIGTPDPRPRLASRDEPVVAGFRCGACGYPAFQPMPDCPVCGGALAEATFGPSGTVFASTCLRVRVPGRPSPRGLSYVDLDEGPRVLAEVSADVSPLPVGTRVVLTGVSAQGDLRVRAEEAS